MSRSGRHCLALCLVAALASCAGPPVATEPVASVVPPPNWRTSGGPIASIDQAWWRSFGDPVLAALVEKALANNVDLGIAAGRVREARANLSVASSQLLPAIDSVLVGGRSRTVSAFGTPLVQTFGQPQVQISYEVDLFGRLADQKLAARDAWLASGAARDSVRLAVAASVASAYIALRGLDARREVVEATIAARAEALRLAKSRTASGYSPRLELEQAQAEYDSAAGIIPQIDLATTRLEDALRLLTGEAPGDVERGTGLEQLSAPAVPEVLPSELLRRRPDIAQAEYQLAASDHNLAAARKRFLPQLRLSAAAGEAFSTLLKNPIAIWSVGGSILAPIFEGGRLKAQAEAAGAQRDQAAFAYRRAALSAFREVEDALQAVKQTDGEIGYAASQRDALDRALRLATNRYREGYSPYLEQLDAQRGYLGAQLSFIQLRTDALTARVQLYQAMGGGWLRCAVPEGSCSQA